MNYLSISFLLFSHFLFLLLIIPFANGAQIMVEIEPNWKTLPEYSSLLEPEQFREVFQSKRFELQIYKEAIQEGISIAGTRVAKERDVFLFENIPEDWMEPTGVVLEIKLPPILSVTKLLLNEESFYQPRIRRPFRILRNRTNMIYGFTILENPERIFHNDIQLPMGETPTGGNEVAYMESLNNSLTKLEQSEQLCAQTKYECNLNLLLKYTHVERRFDAFLKNVLKRTLTVSSQNYATIKAKSAKLFSDIIKLAMTVLEEEKKIFKENVSSSIDLHNSSPAAPIMQLHSQYQHVLDSSQSSQTQTPTTGASSSAAAAGALPMNRKIIFKLIPIERIAQIIAGLQPSRISQPSQINIPAGTNQERMKFIMSDFLSPNSLNSGQSAHFQQVGQQQRVVGQTSHDGPSAGLPQEKGKEKASNILEPATNVEALSSSEETDSTPMGQEQMHSSKTKTKSTDEPRVIGVIGDLEDIWTSEHDPSDRDAHGDALVDEERRERFDLTHELGLRKGQTYNWLFNKKSLLKTSVKIRQEFDSEKKKYQAEMAVNTSASKSNVPTAAANTEALWRHLVRFEDVLLTEQVDMDRWKEELDERSKLENSEGFRPRQISNWINNKKSRLSKNSETIRQQFESEKRKYQSEMAAIGGAVCW